MRFVEIEHVVSKKAKRINKRLIRLDAILKVMWGHTKNPVLYYLTFKDVYNYDTKKVDYVFLTQESYAKLRKILTGVE